MVIHQSQQRQRLIRLVGIWDAVDGARAVGMGRPPEAGSNGRGNPRPTLMQVLQVPLSSTAILKRIKMFFKVCTVAEQLQVTQN